MARKSLDELLEGGVVDYTNSPTIRPGLRNMQFSTASDGSVYNNYDSYGDLTDPNNKSSGDINTDLGISRTKPYYNAGTGKTMEPSRGGSDTEQKPRIRGIDGPKKMTPQEASEVAMLMHHYMLNRR